MRGHRFEALATLEALLSRYKQQSPLKRGALSCLVPRARLELAHPLGHGDLNAARLPIPPPGQVRRALECTD